MILVSALFPPVVAATADLQEPGNHRHRILRVVCAFFIKTIDKGKSVLTYMPLAKKVAFDKNSIHHLDLS